MNLKEATKKACEESTLLKALSFICLWESERAIKQAPDYKYTRRRTPDGAGWETCFKACIESVLKSYKRDSIPLNSLAKIIAENSQNCSEDYYIWNDLPHYMKIRFIMQAEFFIKIAKIVGKGGK